MYKQTEKGADKETKSKKFLIYPRKNLNLFRNYLVQQLCDLPPLSTVFRLFSPTCNFHSHQASSQRLSIFFLVFPFSFFFLAEIKLFFNAQCKSNRWSIFQHCFIYYWFFEQMIRLLVLLSHPRSFFSLSINSTLYLPFRNLDIILSVDLSTVP